MLTCSDMVKPVGPMSYDERALLIAIVFAFVAIPASFIPREPPTAPSEGAAATRLSMKDSFKSLLNNRPYVKDEILLFYYALTDDRIPDSTYNSSPSLSLLGL